MKIVNFKVQYPNSWTILRPSLESQTRPMTFWILSHCITSFLFLWCCDWWLKRAVKLCKPKRYGRTWNSANDDKLKREKYKKIVYPHVFGRSYFSLSLPDSDKTFSSVFSASCLSTQTILSIQSLYTQTSTNNLSTNNHRTNKFYTSTLHVKENCPKLSASANKPTVHLLVWEKSFTSTNNHSTS